MFPYLIMFVGVAAALLLVVSGMSGPSASKSVKRRMELIRERHGDVIAGHAQAQIRKLFAGRGGTKFDNFASTLIPRPALLRKRLEMTGKEISLGKYLAISGGVTLFVAAALMIRGAPLLLATFAALFMGLGLPHFVIGKLIKRRVAKFNSNFPDAIELMVRGLRSGLPI
jgi:tight adherence protein B